MRSGPGSARTILLFHTISARPPKQPRMVESTLRVYRFGLIFVSARTNKRHHHHHHLSYDNAGFTHEVASAASLAPMLSMPFMQVHAHLQEVALRCYPSRKLLVPRSTAHQCQGIQTLSSKDFPDLKFDLAQVWELHSQSSYAAPYGSRCTLLGEPQDSPNAELDHSKYSSLTVLKYYNPDRPKKIRYRV